MRTIFVHDVMRTLYGPDTTVVMVRIQWCSSRSARRDHWPCWRSQPSVLDVFRCHVGCTTTPVIVRVEVDPTQVRIQPVIVDVERHADRASLWPPWYGGCSTDCPDVGIASGTGVAVPRCEVDLGW